MIDALQPPPGAYEVHLTRVHHAARDINLYEFQRPDGGPLPTAEPGAHVDLVLPNGITRPYSLLNTGCAPRSYLVGVKLDPHSRGGSRYIHQTLKVGQTLTIVGPRNNFRLIEHSMDTILFAGGIGITPILAMTQKLIANEKSWTLHYACRTRAEAAFLDTLGDLNETHLHFDDENGGRVLDIATLIAAAPAGSHLYCCGPQPMLAAFELATKCLPSDRVHVEYFTPRLAAATEGGFSVELKRAGKTYFIPPGKTILEVLAEAGVKVQSSCEQGICGSCETRVVEGIPDHRDSVLTSAEKAENKTVMICCAGSKTDRLVLDL